MAQEYFINSQELQNKIRKLLPTQGGSGPGVDLSATTQIVPIIDLTESAEGSDVRADLQTALSFSRQNAFFVSNATTSIITNTGYFRICCSFRISGSDLGSLNLTDGSTSKEIVAFSGLTGYQTLDFIDLIVFIGAGESCSIVSTGTSSQMRGSFRQIANINGDLVNP
jgi:hypothetical protein